MTFYSYQFPNTMVSSDGKVIQFVNGMYSTEDKAEIELLKSLGYDYAYDPVAPEETKGYTIPKRWTTDQIRDFAKENEIEIPESLTTKQQIIEFIEAL